MENMKILLNRNLHGCNIIKARCLDLYFKPFQAIS